MPTGKMPTGKSEWEAVMGVFDAIMVDYVAPVCLVVLPILYFGGPLVVKWWENRS